MSKSTNVSVSMSPQCARAWRRLERSFTGDEAMLPVMVRGPADAWDESATAIGEASDALDLESRSVAPFKQHHAWCERQRRHSTHQLTKHGVVQSSSAPSKGLLAKN